MRDFRLGIPEASSFPMALCGVALIMLVSIIFFFFVCLGAVAPKAFFLPPFTTQMEFNWSAYTSPVLALDVGRSLGGMPQVKCQSQIELHYCSVISNGYTVLCSTGFSSCLQFNMC